MNPLIKAQTLWLIASLGAVSCQRPSPSLLPDARARDASVPAASAARDMNEQLDARERDMPRDEELVFESPELPELPEVMARDPSWHRGVSLGLFAQQGSQEEQLELYAMMLDEIVAAGATDLSVVVRWSQQSVTSDEIQPREGVTTPDELLRGVLGEARARGLRTFLMPIIWLETRRMGVWRGTISPRDEARWWAQYTAFIEHYARIAQDEQVGLLSVGSELLSMETKDQHWRELIAHVRELYDGQLTYSANWDHFEVPTFWDALDVVGLTAYHELTSAQEPTLEELVSGWESFSRRLSRWAAEHDRRYLFTEVGYPSHRLGAAYPWNYSAKARAAPELQALCYHAMLEVWHAQRRLEGLYIWNWFGFKDLDDRGYTPRGKPAEQILKHWYTTSRPPAERAEP